MRIFRFRNITVEINVRRLPAPRSPRETGSADRYYGRPFIPRYTDCWGKIVNKLNYAEEAEYRKGFEEEEDRKVW